jgi:preprotein translocase subunit SecG
MVEKYIAILAVAFFVVALAIGGTSDVQDQQRIEAQYIEFVCKGLWGDYKDLKPNCE